MRKKFSLRQLRDRCVGTIEEIFESLRQIGGEIRGNPGAQHGFLDNGSNILVVAHLDYVGELPLTFNVASVENDLWVICKSLDDRLGVYTILDFLPSIGINCDILLTQNEERGASTANDFITSKKYNWVVEFDRRGMDVVAYQYEKEWQKELKEFFTVGSGSYSDIADLDSLKCCAMNVGVGYHNEHSSYCFFVLQEWFAQIKRFISFYNKYKDMHFEHNDFDNRKRFQYFGYNRWCGWEHPYSGSCLHETKVKTKKTVKGFAVPSYGKDEISNSVQKKHKKRRRRSRKKPSNVWDSIRQELLDLRTDIEKRSKSFDEDSDETTDIELGCELCDPFGFPGFCLIESSCSDPYPKYWAPCEGCNLEAYEVAEDEGHGVMVK